MFWSTASISPKFSINIADVKKWIWECFIFLIPTILFLISQVQVALPSWHLPVAEVIVISYILAQLTSLIKKFVSGPDTTP